MTVAANQLEKTSIMKSIHDILITLNNDGLIEYDHAYHLTAQTAIYDSSENTETSLRLDSISALRLIMEIEKLCCVDLNDSDDLSSIRTIGDLVDLIVALRYESNRA